VIASVGGASLYDVISRLKASSYEIYEIIVVLPQGVALDPAYVADHGLLEIQSPKKGQVAQRALGLGVAQGQLVIQMDDDLCFDTHFLKRYVECFVDLSATHSALALGPRFAHKLGVRRSNRVFSAVREFLKSIYLFTLGGLPWSKDRMGTCSNLTFAAGYDETEEGNSMISQWLAGGCVLTRKDNLILDDFYPFQGKAYCEDLLHSRLRRERNVVQAVATDLEVIISNPKDEISLRQLYSLTQGRWRVGLLLGANKFRLAVLLLVEVLRLAAVITLLKLQKK
jgi:hypothetical protein